MCLFHCVFRFFLLFVLGRVFVVVVVCLSVYVPVSSFLFSFFLFFFFLFFFLGGGGNLFIVPVN